MTFAERMAELHQAVRALRTALALTIAPWLAPSSPNGDPRPWDRFARGADWRPGDGVRYEGPS